MYIQSQREGGQFEIETFEALDRELKKAAVSTVYADRGVPSHSVRLWFHFEDPQRRM